MKRCWEMLRYRGPMSARSTRYRPWPGSNHNKYLRETNRLYLQLPVEAKMQNKCRKLEDAFVQPQSPLFRHYKHLYIHHLYIHLQTALWPTRPYLTHCMGQPPNGWVATATLWQHGDTLFHPVYTARSVRTQNSTVEEAGLSWTALVFFSLSCN